MTLALIGDGSDVQWGGSCFAGRIALNVGRGMALNDPNAAARLKTFTPEWERGALEGATEAFTNAKVGLGLLDWIVELEARDTEARNAKPSFVNLSWKYWLRRVIDRLGKIDPEATRRWLEAVPERMAP